MHWKIYGKMLKPTKKLGAIVVKLAQDETNQLPYYHSQYYKNNFEDSIRYNDPYFKFKWPKKPRVISKKDLNILDFNIKNKK